MARSAFAGAGSSVLLAGAAWTALLFATAAVIGSANLLNGGAPVTTLETQLPRAEVPAPVPVGDQAHRPARPDGERSGGALRGRLRSVRRPARRLLRRAAGDHRLPGRPALRQGAAAGHPGRSALPCRDGGASPRARRGREQLRLRRRPVAGPTPDEGRWLRVPAGRPGLPLGTPAHRPGPGALDRRPDHHGATRTDAARVHAARRTPGDGVGPARPDPVAGSRGSRRARLPDPVRAGFQGDQGRRPCLCHGAALGPARRAQRAGHRGLRAPRRTDPRRRRLRDLAGGAHADPRLQPGEGAVGGVPAHPSAGQRLACTSSWVRPPSSSCSAAASAARTRRGGPSG